MMLKNSRRAPPVQFRNTDNDLKNEDADQAQQNPQEEAEPELNDAIEDYKKQ